MKSLLYLLAILPLMFIFTTVSSYSETHPKKSRHKAKSETVQTVAANNATGLVRAIETVGPAVFKIYVDYQLPTSDPDRPVSRRYTGSGFFIGKDGFAVTALHVIHPSEIPAQFSPVQITACLAMYSEVSGVKTNARFLCADIDLAEIDQAHDLALLKLRNKNELPAPVNTSGNEIKPIINAASLRLRAPRDGTQIAISGFPLNTPVLITSSGWLASSSGEYAAGNAPPSPPGDSAASETADVYLANMRIIRGNDGGPVYSAENGEVIGVGTTFQITPAEGTNESIIYNSGLGLIIPSKYIVELVKKHKLNLK